MDEVGRVDIGSWQCIVRVDAEPACEDLLQNNIENVEDLGLEPRSHTLPILMPTNRASLRV